MSPIIGLQPKAMAVLTLETPHRFHQFIKNKMKVIKLIFTIFFCLCIGIFTQAEESGGIPQSDIEKLEQSYGAAFAAATSTLKRRAFKRVVRRAKALVKKNPNSEARFQVQSIIFKCQQNLMMINNKKDTREAVFATARELAQAPMTYSKLRLQADILLLRNKIASKSVSDEERVKSIKDMAELYLKSDAEAKCLMHLVLIVKDMKNHELFKELKFNLNTRFSHDPEVAAFMREYFKVSKRDLRFQGVFRTMDRKLISFPTDLIGHNTMICFWSTTTPDLKKKFEAIKNYQEKTNGNFKVFSFNIDKFKDGGQSILTENGCDWIAMDLPKGMRSKTFLAFGHKQLKYTLLSSNAAGYSIGNLHIPGPTTKHDPDAEVYSILNDAQ